MARKQVNDPTALCVKCGKGKQFSKQLCQNCYNKAWYANRWAPPAKAAPPGVQAEIDQILDGYLRYEAPAEPYHTPSTSECIEESDRVEIEAASKDWSTMEAKAKEELTNAKRDRVRNKDERRGRFGDSSGRYMVRQYGCDDPADCVPAARRRGG